MDTFITVLVCFIASAGAGLGTGFAGMSAAAVIGPMLTTFLGVPAFEAVGIGLFSDVLASAISAFTYKKSGNLDIRNSLPLIVTVLLFTVLGSFVATFLPDKTMSGTMQIALIFIGLRFLIKPITTTNSQFQAISSRRKWIGSIIGGSFVGFICGFVGAGGGMMLLFVLTSFLAYPLHLAVGTSVFIMTFTALIGGSSHFIFGKLTNFLCLALCVCFTLLWARIASRIANKSNPKTLNRVVGIIMIITGAVILLVNYLI